MLDLKALSVNGQQYFFQVVPLHINLLSSSVLNSLNQKISFKLILVKGNYKTDQTKKLTQANIINNQIIFQQSQLNFHIQNYNPNRKINFSIQLIKINQNGQQIQIGNGGINPYQYANNFRKGLGGCYKQILLISDEYSIQLEIFVDKSRFSLEKTIREIRSQIRLIQSKQIVRRSTNKTNRPQPLEINSQAYSQTKPKTQQVQAKNDKFMSPKKYIRKPQGQQRKLKKKEKGQNSISASDRNDQIQSGAEGDIQKSSRKPQDRPNFMDKSTRTVQPMKITLGIDDNQQQFLKKSANAKSSYSPSKKEPKKGYIKRTDSLTIRNQEQLNAQRIKLTSSMVLNDSRNVVSQNILTDSLRNSQPQPQKPNTQIRTIIAYLIFFFISIFLIYNAMAPGKKYRSKRRF